MKFHNITHDDMKNGDGLRVVLWVSGCGHHCKECQNSITWNPDIGIEFDLKALSEIIQELNKPYISGLTISGGDPLYPMNRECVKDICNIIKIAFPNKTIWVYTGYEWEMLLKENDNNIKEIIKCTDVIVDGNFINELKDVNYHWAGSTNQRVIDVKNTLKERCVILYGNN